MLNREQRRKYERQIKKVKYASICPECGMKVRFMSARKSGEETALICEVCGTAVRQGENVTRSIPPGMYLPMPLDRFDRMVEEMLAEDQKRAEEEKAEENSSDEEEVPKEEQRYGSKVYPKREGIA